jgi:hypothetical protein
MKGNTVCVSKRGGGSHIHTADVHTENNEEIEEEDETKQKKHERERRRSKKKTWSKCKSVVYSREVVGAGAFPAFLHLIIIPARIAARLFSLSLSLSLSLSAVFEFLCCCFCDFRVVVKYNVAKQCRFQLSKVPAKKKTYKETLSLSNRQTIADVIYAGSCHAG